jgi:RNA polymerase sigma-54 factor
MPLILGQFQKQVQRLVMTPQMQQSIKLLQMNALELEQLTEQEMLENPFLELSDERETSTQEDSTPQNASDDIPLPSTEPPATKADKEAIEALPKDLTKEPETFDKVDVNWEEVYDFAENKVYFQREKYEEHDFTEYTALTTSLIDFLDRQIRLSTIEGKGIKVAEYLIGSIDHDGYLHATLQEVADKLKVDIELVEDVLDIIQTFDPPGIAARDLAECLRLQLEDQDVRDSFIYILIDDHLVDLQKKNFKEIARAMGVDHNRVIKAFHRIARLEPKPGRRYSKEQPQYIKADVIIKKIDGKYIYFLNEGRFSHLAINPYYMKMLKQKHQMDKQDKTFAMEKFRGAVWFLKNIEKRKSTILRITEAIMKAQMEFLDKGIQHLKPLTLREVAEEVEMHESTVARVTTRKYVETPRGIFELKFFFSSGLETASGENTSSRSVKDKIAQIIEDEPPQKPLSDQKISNLLAKEGIKIARRTVAKYREQLRILPTKLRKQAT